MLKVSIFTRNLGVTVIRTSYIVGVIETSQLSGQALWRRLRINAYFHNMFEFRWRHRVFLQIGRDKNEASDLLLA